MKKKILVCAFMLLIGLVNAQKLRESQIDIDLKKIVELKIEYERCQGNKKKADSIIGLYKGQVNKIKKSPKIYLGYINRVLKYNEDRLKNESFPYKFLTVPESNISLKRHVIQKGDFYRVVKYSLFKKNMEILPEDFRGLKIVDERNYNGYDKAKRKDFKLARKALLSSLLLSRQEVQFIKNDVNQVYVIGMKKYLDENGLNNDNQMFIKWAINYLIKYPGVSIAYLDNAYEPIRNKHYLPRDRKN